MEQSSHAAASRSADVQPFVLTRTVKAPRALVWKAFTEPERLQQWFGPKGFTGRTVNMEFRPGGMYLYSLKGPDGTEIWGKHVYREITAPERIHFVQSFSDPQGGTTIHPLNPAWPKEMLSTYAFADQGEQTLITISWVPLNATETEAKTFDAGRSSMTQGWAGTCEQLDQYLANAK